MKKWGGDKDTSMVANKHMKEFSLALTIRETQIKVAAFNTSLMRDITSHQ